MLWLPSEYLLECRSKAGFISDPICIAFTHQDPPCDPSQHPSTNVRHLGHFSLARQGSNLKPQIGQSPVAQISAIVSGLLGGLGSNNAHPASVCS